MPDWYWTGFAIASVIAIVVPAILNERSRDRARHERLKNWEHYDGRFGRGYNR